MSTDTQRPDEVWREYLTPIGKTIERARLFERMLAAQFSELAGKERSR